MSRASVITREQKYVDAIVLAGGRGTSLISARGRKVHKPYLELGGEPLVRRVVRSLLQADNVGKVYVVGSLPVLEAALAPLAALALDRLDLVPEGDNLVDNCYRAFFLHLLADKKCEKIQSSVLDPETVYSYYERHPDYRDIPALFVTSDLPFITSEAVDCFLDLVPPAAELAFGVVDHVHLEKMQGILGDGVLLDSWKLGALHLSGASVRLNNLFLVRPLAANPVTYPLLLDLYKHRWLLRQDGTVHSRNWWLLSRSIISHSYRLPGRLRFLRSMLNFVPAALAMFLARMSSKIGGRKWLAKPFRVFLRKRDMEFIGSLMIDIRGYLTLCPFPGPAFDIDVEESYQSLAKNGEQAFRKIMAYLEKEGDRQGGNLDSNLASGS